MNRHTFDGEIRTIDEIRKLVPKLSETTIRRYLKAGRNTRQAMMNYDPKAKYREAGKKSRANAKSRGWGFA